MGNTLLRGSLVLALGLLTTALSGASRQARAGETTISVLGLEPAAGAPDAVATAVTEAIRQRVSATSGYRLVPGRDLVEVKLVFSCPDEAPPCMTQAAQSIGAAKLVFGGLQPVGTEAYLVTLKLLDADRDVVENWSSEQITKDQTSPKTLRKPAQKWFAALTGQATPGAIKVEGGVLGAGVWLDGAQVGLLGNDGLLLGGIPSGTHMLVVSKSGYEKFERTVMVTASATEKVAVELTPIETPGKAGLEPPPATAVEEPPRFLPSETSPGASAPHQGDRIAAWALLGAGIVSIGLGAYSSYQVSVVNSNLDPLRRYPCVTGGATTCDPSGKIDLKARTPEEEAYVSDQKDKGDMYTKIQWVGYGLGGALVATSAVFFYRGYLSPSARTAKRTSGTLLVMPSLGPNSAGAVALMRF